jgi:oxalate decarboxylase/phosphoglucose isomerase-like protein (cupin superfamily)
MRDFCKRRVFFWTENDLGQTLTIAQIGKNHAAMVAGGIDPSNQGHRLVNVGKAELVAMMCAHDGNGGRLLKREKPKKSMDFSIRDSTYNTRCLTIPHAASVMNAHASLISIARCLSSRNAKFP